jgi:WhiB family transcriptional regulator, redox-sensing transcriptional regulator
MTTTDDRIPTTASITARNWRKFAACLAEDPEDFFSTPTELAEILHAKSICAVCPVRRACLVESFDFTEAGVWGGASEDERRRARRRVLRVHGSLASENLADATEQLLAELASS